MPIEFFIISFVLTIIPGTGVLYAVSCGLAQGARGAFWGAVSGHWVWFPIFSQLDWACRQSCTLAAYC